MNNIIKGSLWTSDTQTVATLIMIVSSNPIHIRAKVLRGENKGVTTIYSYPYFRENYKKNT